MTAEKAQQLVLHYYGLSGHLEALPGEADINYKLTTGTDDIYTVKISQPSSDASGIEFQAAIMDHMASKQMELSLPTVQRSLGGEKFILIGKDQYLRVQKWVSGQMLSDVNPRSSGLLRSWGKTCGVLSKNLAGFDHPSAHRFYKWNPSESLYSKKYRDYLQVNSQKEIADYFWNLFELQALPKLKALRKSVNYNDAHEHNLLVHQDLLDPVVTGAIDFGDAIYTETINEVAIACAYAGMTMADPLEAMCQVVCGYHEIFPIKEKEIQVLFPLIAGRLLITVTSAAWNKHQEPENEYLQISVASAWELLNKLRSISPDFAHMAFRSVCGFEASPVRATFNKWVADEKNKLADVVELKNRSILPLDLSVGSQDLGNNSNFESIPNFHTWLDRLMEDRQANLAIGGYGEVRPIYTTDAYKVEGNQGAQWRTVHLGTDFWAPAGSPVYTPLAGTVHSFHNNAADRDYGPAIILEHQVSDELTFYTLYGHLSVTSLEGLSVGMAIKKGQQIATIGPAPENGNWPPHLHFQILLNTFGNKGDFPGVAFPHEREIWLSNCPNPQLFYKEVPDTIQPTPLNEILATRKNNLGKSLSISYKKPLHIVRGFNEYLYDTTGRRYLDTVNNVAHVGHEHPRVLRAMHRQAGVLNTNTRYVHDQISKFSEELLDTFPPELCVVHFVNSGSEATELALRIVEAYTGQKNMIAIESGYHGNTGGSIGISSYKFDGKGGKGAPPHCHLAPMPDLYRGRHRDVNTGIKYADYVRQSIKDIEQSGEKVGGFICESILSCGGQIPLPSNYLYEVYGAVRAAGGLCIADEVQVGFGRVGLRFWGFQLQSVIPDIVTLGKPIGNGHPLAAVVTTREVADAFANGMEYFNTFGGNPVSCAIGREVLQIIKDENLQEHAVIVGRHLLSGLNDLMSKHTIIGDVRGHGLFLGFELVKNRETLEPAADEATYLVNRMRQRGILMSTDGPHHNVLKIKPPMCFSKKSADFLLENLNIVLEENFLTETK